MKKLLSLCGLALTFVVLGCSTVNSRIKEKSVVFNSLDAQTQARLQQGLVDVGYTSDMVYIAMGKPDEVKQRVNNKGDESDWIYKSYWQEYQGNRLVGYHRILYYDAYAKAYRIYYEPVRADVFRDRVEDRTRVSFVNGKVSAIEQAKE